MPLACSEVGPITAGGEAVRTVVRDVLAVELLGVANLHLPNAEMREEKEGGGRRERDAPV